MHALSFLLMQSFLRSTIAITVDEWNCGGSLHGELSETAETEVLHLVLDQGPREVSISTYSSDFDTFITVTDVSREFEEEVVTVYDGNDFGNADDIFNEDLYITLNAGMYTISVGAATSGQSGNYVLDVALESCDPRSDGESAKWAIPFITACCFVVVGTMCAIALCCCRRPNRSGSVDADTDRAISEQYIGYLDVDYDLERVYQMSVNEAKQYALTLPNCTGFTCWPGDDLNEPKTIWFKHTVSTVHPSACWSTWLVEHESQKYVHWDTDSQIEF